MKMKLFSNKTFGPFFLVVFTFVLNSAKAQTYLWNGTTSDFYTTSNWTTTDPLGVVFDDSSFKIVRTNAVTSPKLSPVINSFVAWRPGVFDNLGGHLTLNANFNVFFNDFLNGTVDVNADAIFNCSNIFRIGREGIGLININGGTISCNDPSNWQGIFIGVLSGGNGTVNVNNNGIINGGYQVEVGTRDFYPAGTLNINSGGASWAYWATNIGPNGTINLNGGTLNTGESFRVGDLSLDNASNSGSVGSVVGALNINSGTVIVNQNDLAGINFILNTKAKVKIDTGSLIIKRTGVDFTNIVNNYVTGGQIVPQTGKKIVAVYDGVNTTVTAIDNLGRVDFNSKSLAIYPNPVEDVINIISKLNFSENMKISIVDIFGAIVLETQLETKNNDEYSIPVKGKLSSGIYFVKLHTANENYVSKIIVK